MAGTWGRRGPRAALRTRTRTRTRSTARGIAVALALTAGVTATVATSPGPRDPCPTTSATISSFYGAQDEEGPRKEQWTGYSPATIGPFEVNYAGESVRACVGNDEDKGVTPVRVWIHVATGAPTSVRDIFLRGAVLTDGRGGSWSVQELSVEEDELPVSSDAAPSYEVELRFDLPLDVREPVVLELPNVGGPYDVPQPFRVGPFS